MRSGMLLSLEERSSVERSGMSRPRVSGRPRAEPRRSAPGEMRRCRAEERREGGLDIGARQPRVDGPNVEEVETFVEYERRRFLRAGRVGVVRTGLTFGLLLAPRSSPAVTIKA